jgi:plastocyanin
MNTTSTLKRSLGSVLVVAGLTMVLAACGSSSSSSSSAPADTSSAAGGGGGSGTPVTVMLKDFAIAMPKMALQPGTYTFNVVNNGPSSHNLTIDGPGVSDQATPTFASGGSQKLTVTLKDGVYDFFCSVPGHKAAGMDLKVTVGSGGAGGGAATTDDSSGGSSSSGGGWS